jgi:hypothetical protein
MPSIDQRTRRYDAQRELPVEELIDGVLTTAVSEHGDLGARGQAVMEVPALGLDIAGVECTLRTAGAAMVLTPGLDRAEVVVRLDVAAASRLVQDVQSTMGLAMTSDVTIERGTLDDWIGWEPVLRALLDGRPVHEPGMVELLDPGGEPLDTGRAFSLDDDRGEMEHFLGQAGFLHLAGVFDAADMAPIAADLDAALERAQPDDGASWWATDADGTDRPVRVLFFNEQSEALAGLLADERLTRLAELTDDDHAPPQTAEGLVKPLGIVRGLSDLPWHKDCGQGHHSYQCSGLTVGISVTGADRDSGALGVVPGSHRANTLSAMRDRRLDLPSRKLETATGDLTVHCSDTLHRAHPPVTEPRKVVYTSLRLRPLPGDTGPLNPNSPTRQARASLSTVEDRIEAADGGRTRLGAR